jgi:hypothetical protein
MISVKTDIERLESIQDIIKGLKLKEEKLKEHINTCILHNKDEMLKKKITELKHGDFLLSMKNINVPHLYQCVPCEIQLEAKAKHLLDERGDVRYDTIEILIFYEAHYNRRITYSGFNNILNNFINDNLNYFFNTKNVNFNYTESETEQLIGYITVICDIFVISLK